MLTLLSLFAFGSLVLSVQAATNVTVDDTDATHVTYNPGSTAVPGWNAEPGCVPCSLKPDPSQAYNKTWHDDLWEAGDTAVFADLTFTGTAVYIYNIVPNNEINANTNLTFTVDGKAAGHYTYVPNNQSDFLYNVSVFSAEKLSNAQHTVQMTTIGTNGTGDLAILFDYFVYTTENGTTSTTGSLSISSTSSATTTKPSSSSKTTATTPASSSSTGASSSPSTTGTSAASSAKRVSTGVVLSLIGGAILSLL